MSMERIVLVLVSIVLCGILVSVDAQINYVVSQCNGDDFNYTDGSIYQNNIDLLLDKLTPKSSSLKFYNSTSGTASNQVYGLYQCRYDVPLSICNECVKDATQKIVADCPLAGEAVTWYYQCTLWYANRNMYSVYATYPGWFVWDLANVSNYAEFAPVQSNALNGVIKNASLAMPHYASNITNLSLFEQLYSFAQCTPDLDTSGCNNCLKTALSRMIKRSNTSIWGMAFFPSCQLRYDMAPFLIDQLTPDTSPAIDEAGPVKGKKSSLKPGLIAAIVACVAIGLVVLPAILWIALCHKKQPKKAIKDVTENFGEPECVQYDFATLNTATDNFSAKNDLGKGGFGTVYKGTMENGDQLAVKRLSSKSSQGQNAFMTEARLLAKLQHKNLVKLLGFCSEGEEKLLVYEFMPNSSLDGLLFDPKNQPLLEWVTRCKILMGIARGLQYLHEDSRLTIIHRDLKPGNVLLDKEMNPKIADFGLARLFEVEQKFGNSSRAAGTPGYIAPEYLASGEYSVKSDVYSYGIMLLEIVSGQSNLKFYQFQRKDDLAVYAWRLWNEERTYELTDPMLFNNAPKNEVIRCIHIGLLCLQANPDQRPTMGLVVSMLTGSVDLPIPSEPGKSFPQFNPYI